MNILNLFQIDQCKEKKEAASSSEGSSKKRRWFVRIQRSSNCHARIHLRVQYNKATNDYDAETQMIYYPQHTHNKEDEESPEDTERVLERNHRDKSLYYPKNGNCERIDPTVTSSVQNANLTSQADASSSSGRQRRVVIGGTDENVVELPGGGTLMARYMNEFCQTQLEGEIESSPMFVTVSGSENGNVAGGASTVVVQNSAMPGRVVVDGGGEETVLVDGGRGSAFVVQDGIMVDVGQAGVENVVEAEGEEYVLPADEAEWTKLFEVLRNRLASGELDGREKSEAEALKAYQDVVSFVSLPEQVDIFQRLCSLTNTAFESAE